MAELPKIRLRHSRALTTKVSPIILQHWRGPEAKLPEPGHYQERLESYQHAWQAKEQAILSALIDATGLSFYLPVIDATFAPMMPQFSTPLTLSYKFEPDETVDNLTHELIHILLSDNKEQVMFGQFLTTHWPNEEAPAPIHVLVHALSKFVYLDVLGEPSRLERDISAVQANPPYKRAWEIVESEGADHIIAMLKQHVDDVTNA